ncbi:hypothetical protein DMN91_008843 [Ooceraea biroi]|uniref:Putative E3 ubiquitin-protein ligase sinah n=1 Tax=Ooceraea biroi TaxID=2015173 RepID=A0A026WKE3_OOCBI|nr:uncharacterized protein LOC105279046 [Ooceraea biroi]EZA55569.1 putative E3 ubiquitin-protein ligase sinah [Ooceraea biroi]RLU18486.1 hypothetical protein DMN91_008843 [Ooceraea biroi]
MGEGKRASGFPLSPRDLTRNYFRSKQYRSRSGRLNRRSNSGSRAESNAFSSVQIAILRGGMPHSLHPRVLAEVAGVKIVTSLPEEDANSLAPGKMILQMQKTSASPEVHGKSCGFHLTKSKWDPYPWIGYVEDNSPADLAGLKAGDCLLAVDDNDLLGLKIRDIAALIRAQEGARNVNLSVWRYTHENEEQNSTGLALKGPLPDVARNLASAVSGTVRALECPICLESAAPPVSQCVHGHILCVVCRPKTTRCPVCRVRLGQGRCLLADKLHRVLRDTFNVNGMTDEAQGAGAPDRSNLRDQLFGRNKCKKQEAAPTASRARGNCTLKPRQFLLTRLLGGREKAASADNLTRVSEISEEAVANGGANNLRVQLSPNDRAKSASTGELSKDNKARIDDDDSSSRMAELSTRNTSQQSLSLPRTPVWGGSTDSVSSAQLACPLLQSCRESVTSDSLLEHIRTHAVPQVHFYSGGARIPLPVPFGCEALYIFHHGSDIFFFQCGEETAWMMYPARNTCTSNTWEWTMHAWGDNGTEVQLRRQVASLEDPVTLSSHHIAPLPSALLLKAVNVQISEHRAHDRLYM